MNQANLNVKRNETELQYIWRICSQKEILGYTWEQIAEILNKNLKGDETEFLSESAYRKKYQQAKEFKEEVFDLNMDNIEDRIDEYRQIKMEAEMAKKEAQTERLFVNRRLRETTRARMIQDKTQLAIYDVESMDIPNFKPLNVGDKDSEYLLAFSDVHAYKIVDIVTNKYDKEELEKRLNSLISETVDVINSEKIEKLTIVNGGDNLQNVLRKSDLGVLEDGVIPTVVKYRRFMAEWLKKLSEYVKVDYIHLTEANHSEYRALGAKTNLMARDNFELSIATYIEDLLSENTRVKVIVPDRGYYIHEMAGYNMLFHHGHGRARGKDKTKFVADIQRKERIFIDYLILGHTHNEDITTLGESFGHDVQVLVIPSIIGTDGYADYLNTGSKASGLMWRFTKGRGKDRTYKFILN